MNNALKVASLFFVFVHLPLAWYAGFLLYRHVQATELMWFLYIINIPISLISAMIGEALKRASNKD